MFSKACFYELCINTDSAMFPPEMWVEFSLRFHEPQKNACESFYAELNAMFYCSYSLKIICRYVYYLFF